MGAKIVLAGQPKEFKKQDRGVSFFIVTGPATRHPPRGLKLYGPTRYRVECTDLQWRRARHDPSDETDLIVEGYLEPQRDPETGHLYVAVVATAMQSMLVQSTRKLEQLEQALEDAREAFKRAREADSPRSELEEKAAALVKADESVQQFLGKHPTLKKE